jgi:hypothetical protein
MSLKSIATNLFTRAITKQLVAKSEVVHQEFIESKQILLRTLTIGKIVSVSGQRAAAQPLLGSLLSNGEIVRLPLIVDAPLEYPSGGDMIMTFPVAVGDECIIAFSDRCLEEWQQLGGMQTPEYRLHDLTDAVIRVGIASDPNCLSDISTTAVEIRSRDNVVKISIDPTEAGTITLQAAVVNVIGTLKENGVPIT